MKNNAPQMLAAFLALSATATSAQLTRAGVNAQLKAAQASGALGALIGEDSGSAYLASRFRSAESRDEVKSGVKQASADATLNVLYRSDSGSVYLSRHQALRTPRVEVRSELATARTNSTLGQMYGEDSGSFVLSSVRSHAASRPVLGSK